MHCIYVRTYVGTDQVLSVMYVRMYVLVPLFVFALVTEYPGKQTFAHTLCWVLFYVPTAVSTVELLTQIQTNGSNNILHHYSILL